MIGLPNRAMDDQTSPPKVPQFVLGHSFPPCMQRKRMGCFFAP